MAGMILNGVTDQVYIILVLTRQPQSLSLPISRGLLWQLLTEYLEAV